MFMQQIVNGLSLGCIYALVALGFTLIYKTTKAVNFAQGEFMMLGAFIAYLCIDTFHFSFSISVILTILFMAIFGMFVERVFLRSMLGQPLWAIVMLTFALSILIRSVIGLLWTHEVLSFPPIFPKEPIKMGHVFISSVSFWIIIVSILLLISLYAALKFTRMGTNLRACGMNQLATLYMGVSIKKLFSLTWASSSIIAGISGILLAPVVFLSTNMGYIGMNAIPAALVGGLGSIPGAVVGGIIIGVSEVLAGSYLPRGLKDIFAYLILIVVLMIRPSGLFGIPEKKRV